MNNTEDLRAAILASDDLPREAVDVPWDLGGAKLYVRGLTAAEKDAWYARTMPDGDFKWGRNLQADLLVKTLVTENGERIFTDDDIEELGSKGAAVVSQLMDVAMRLSGLTDKTAEEAEADFDGAQNDASLSA